MFAVKFAHDVEIYAHVRRDGSIRGVDKLGRHYRATDLMTVSTFAKHEDALAIAERCINWPNVVIVEWVES